ncbi:MAG: CpsD/CapB family tyrosine-protein kinase [Candidatus Omnitrophota bacterium]
MTENDNFDKISEALKRAAEEKERFLRGDAAPPAFNEKAYSYEGNVSNPTETGIDHKIVTYFNARDPIVEQFRALRAHICSNEKTCDLRTVGITSSSRREGKSLVSVNLSVVLAQDSARPVLLVDCNLRAPSVNTLLGLPNDKGLSDLLTGKIKLDEALIKTGIRNLNVLTAGGFSENPAELMGSRKMAELLTELKAKFYVVVLDLPSVMHYADPRMIGPMLDGVVMVARAGVTRREVIVRAEGILKSVGCNLLGYVLTGIEYHIPDYIHRHL